VAPADINLSMMTPPLEPSNELCSCEVRISQHRETLLKLPPLNSVRTFEVAGRLGSFLRAAEELNVTPGAVSKQIALLEDFVGTDLFERMRKPVRLTAAGEAYLASVRRALAIIEESTREIRRDEADKPLHIWSSRFFMQKWLVPKLASFQAANPHLEVVITTGLSSEPMPAEADIGIRFGSGPWAGFKAHALIGMRLIPVCSPRYLASHPPLDAPAALARHTLLQNLYRPNDWGDWLRHAGVPTLPITNRISFESSLGAYSAAMEGLGVALGRCGFIEDDLAAGRLVSPLPMAAETEGAFHLVYRDRARQPLRVARFRRWILDEIANGWARAKAEHA
jgi:LysR family glycine cleavage system transcriptional activator